METGNSTMKSILKLLPALLLLANVGFLNQPAMAQKVLQGRVEHADENTRLKRPAGNLGERLPGQVESTRLQRSTPMEAPSFKGSLVDTNTFRQPLAGRATDDGVQLGLLKPNDFANLPNKFDMGAERGSKEMVLAWERWHKQLSEAIYTRWSETADTPGRATVRLTVTKNNQVIPVVVSSSGSRRFDRGLLEAISSLNGNPGLTFPKKSQRERVEFETDYVASTDVKSGYSWVKNDFEKVRENY
jgi:outer membrane biosynthesis protein TonB